MNKEKGVPGPEPERLKLPHRKWKDAVKEALEKERPEGGWPEESEPENEDERKK